LSIEEQSLSASPLRPGILFNNQKSTINNDSSTIAARTNPMAIGPIQLIRQATPAQRRTLLAAAMGWALDGFDAMLYSLVLTMLMRDLDAIYFMRRRISVGGADDDAVAGDAREKARLRTPAPKADEILAVDCCVRSEMSHCVS
jgi:hypothetical protein